jgi:tetratricopeptide (TPR) repeat protein
MKTKIIYYISGFIVVVVTVFFVTYDNNSDTLDIPIENDMSTTTEDTNSTTTSSVNIGEGGSIDIDNPDGATITILPPLPTMQPPKLNRPITYPEFYFPEAVAIMEVKLADAIAAAEENGEFGDWIDLATLYHQIEDFEGARIIYEYLNEVYPTNSISFLNLANLHYLFLREYEKAEILFRKAIDNSPGSEVAYTSFHDLYKYSYKKETTLAVDILMEGLSVLPNNINFMTKLGLYYSERGETDLAKQFYTDALLEAKKLGNNDLAVLIQTEINNL